MSKKILQKAMAALLACLLCLTAGFALAEGDDSSTVVIPEQPATRPDVEVPENPATRPPETPTNPPATQAPSTPTRRPSTPSSTPRATAAPVVAIPTEVPEPTATPAPVIVYTELDPSAEMHSISTAEGLSLLEAMRILGLELQPEVDAGTTDVAVLHLDEVLTPDELAALEQLSVHDRLLVALTVTGFSYVVRDALDQNPVLMSDEAVQLMDAIALRIEELPEEEQQAVQKTIQERFPLIMSAQNDMESILYNVDLVVTQEGTTSYERYGFRFTNGAWLMSSISLGAVE